MKLKRLIPIVEKFFSNCQVLNIEEIDSGFINKTYIVEHLYNGVKSKFILQNLSNIFESHEIINKNHKLITDHINKKINKNDLSFYISRWELPNLIKCESNKLFILPFESGLWRAMTFIDQTFSCDCLQDQSMAYQTGIGLSKFHLACSDLDASKLESSIKNFHNTKYYIDKYVLSLNEYDFINTDEKVKIRINDLSNSISRHIRYAEFLYLSLKRKSLELNVIHGDPKISNFLFDIKQRYVVSLIDLDTVSSGYLLTDLADCIRSICNNAGEETKNKENIVFDLNSLRYFLNGYFSLSNKQINCSFKFIPEFIYLIIFELTIRFFTDFLQSNRYFKVGYETHNLFRAEVQFQLLSSFLCQIPNVSKELHEIGILSSSVFVSDVQKFI